MKMVCFYPEDFLRIIQLKKLIDRFFKIEYTPVTIILHEKQRDTRWHKCIIIYSVRSRTRDIKQLITE